MKFYRNFRVAKVLSRSVILNWDIDQANNTFQIFLRHDNETTVENVTQIQLPFELHGLSMEKYEADLSVHFLLTTE